MPLLNRLPSRKNTVKSTDKVERSKKKSKKADQNNLRSAVKHIRNSLVDTLSGVNLRRSIEKNILLDNEKLKKHVNDGDEFTVEKTVDSYIVKMDSVSFSFKFNVQDLAERGKGEFVKVVKDFYDSTLGSTDSSVVSSFSGELLAECSGSNHSRLERPVVDPITGINCYDTFPISEHTSTFTTRWVPLEYLGDKDAVIANMSAATRCKQPEILFNNIDRRECILLTGKTYINLLSILKSSVENYGLVGSPVSCGGARAVMRPSEAQCYTGSGAVGGGARRKPVVASNEGEPSRVSDLWSRLENAPVIGSFPGGKWMSISDVGGRENAKTSLDGLNLIINQSNPSEFAVTRSQFEYFIAISDSIKMDSEVVSGVGVSVGNYPEPKAAIRPSMEGEKSASIVGQKGKPSFKTEIAKMAARIAKNRESRGANDALSPEAVDTERESSLEEASRKAKAAALAKAAKRVAELSPTGEDCESGQTTDV